MYPVNQVILGGDSMFNSMEDIDLLIQRMESYRQKLKQLKDLLTKTLLRPLIWDEIDSEVSPLSIELKNRLMQNSEYVQTYNDIQALVLLEILNLVKGRIESTERGKNLLSKQLDIIKRLKTKIIEDTNREMELFMKFREYSKTHPNTSYEEFIKDSEP